MATVTKLKAEVNNINLPILGEDGNLYNYYVGSYSNKLSELGYDLTNSEIQAMNALVNAGINDGWIDKVLYLLPFIGNETNPITGIVPLIDKVNNYELAEESVDAKLFSYDNGKIKCMGGRSDNANISAKLPLKTNLGTYYAFAPFINATLEEDDIVVSARGSYTFSKDSVMMHFSCRKGYSTTKYFQFGIKTSQEIETSYTTITGSNFEEPCNAGVFFGRYTDNSGYKSKRYVTVRGETQPRSSDMRGNEGLEIPTVNDDVYIGSYLNIAIKFKINLYAFMDIKNLTSSDMRSFNNAVFEFTSALGR